MFTWPQGYIVPKAGHDYWDYAKVEKSIESFKKGGIMSVVNKVRQLAKSKDFYVKEIPEEIPETWEMSPNVTLKDTFDTYL